MFDITISPPPERIILAGLITPQTNKSIFDEDMAEMAMLCITAGAQIVDTTVQKMDSIQPATYLGTGKLEQIHQSMKHYNCSTLVLDAELSPSQVKNIEKIIQGKVIDRSQLILDIFARHARTNEAKIQVELAQLRTLYPRLTHAWSHFSQQVGGIGTRGPGEKQLEIDRRLVQKKIHDLEIKLKKIERSRATQRKQRATMLHCALVGYTNVGKSSLLNALSGSDLLVENKLFATLDTATRKIYLPQIGYVIISDTVGFLRKLPHSLIASFKSTLEVAKEADLLLVVLDASSSWTDQQYATAIEVLKELAIENVPQLIILNKSDLIESVFDRKKISIQYPDSLIVSAFNAEQIQQLKLKIQDVFKKSLSYKIKAHYLNNQPVANMTENEQSNTTSNNVS